MFCRRSISINELKEGDKCIMEFCDSYKAMFGSSMCTMNLHLHGHLRQCIEDYGPVYACWCFSYERLNGILGGYPTNSHHISVQLASRFLENKLFAPENWPNEYVEEYVPLLQHFNYNRGSLIQTALVHNQNDIIHPLPPVKECAFQPFELEELQALISYGRECQYEVSVLHHRYSAILLQTDLFSHVIGAENSRHSRSSLLLCQKNDSFFAKCTARNSQGEMLNKSVAAVSWYASHPCHVWFGRPTQVWACPTSTGYRFIPVSNIRSPVVYCKATINFGRIGVDSVYVIVPLDI